MIEQKGTFDRLLKAIENGAQLRIDCAQDFEGAIWEYRARLERDGKSVIIPVETARRIEMHPDIREGYAGYRSDYARKWSNMFEHKLTPSPRWVTEQWGWDEETGAFIK